MKSDVLDYSVDGAVCTITLNRPQSLNSFDMALRRDLLAALRLAEGSNDVRVIVLKGEGRGFCAGADLSEGVDKAVDQMLEEEYKPFLLAIAESSKICIAQVHGSAAGIAGALAMVCDIVVMAEDAYMYLAFAAIGLVPDGGLTWHLLRAMGYRRAFETIVEGQKLDAQTCLNFGIANELVAPDALDVHVTEKARKLAEGAPLAQAAVKRLLRQVGSVSLADAISLEATEQQPLTETSDCREAIAAFFKKEKPVFKGQ